METEIPAILRARELAGIGDETFTFHSSRMRMKKVTKAELEAMDRDSLRCAAELADAPVDVVGYACLVAIMSMGVGYHRTSETQLEAILQREGRDVSVVTSAGALVEELKRAGVRSVSIVTPYLRPLTDLVVGYIRAEGVAVVDSIALSIEDNVTVGKRDPLQLLDDIGRLDIGGVDAVVLSACVQMPSLDAVALVEDKLGLPVTSASICTTRRMLGALGLAPLAPRAGYFMSEKNLAANSLGRSAAETVECEPGRRTAEA
ncbi:Asp/Glu racemase [Bradyrhizobium sp. BRP22]|uniref:maleate cis-trans isomerase family protein n=1 Tax=Bradyrhizobium sp. BRP22 TaxID=2793821 RepID=UPI001CD6CB3C|nr:Asp/Glu racemase [Bradyrhizobium sp. BRP22]MCA1457065.1 Asp/Glu racemase [Bradyrhizobium sp. BRP22]